MNSTTEKPLLFFEYSTNKQVFKEIIIAQLENYDVQIIELNQDKEFVRFSEKNEDGEPEESESDFKKIILPLLYREFQKSKNYLVLQKLKNM